MDRRKFLTIAAGGAAAAALAACGDGEVSGLAVKVTTIGGGGGGGGGGANQVLAVVGDYAGLATTGKLVMIDNSFVAVKRTGATTFDAFFMACTHQGCLTTIVTNAFVCPCHGSKFDSNGAVTLGPANTSLAKLPASYNPATDTLTIN